MLAARAGSRPANTSATASPSPRAARRRVAPRAAAHEPKVEPVAAPTAEGDDAPSQRRQAREDARNALKSSSEYVWRMSADKIDALVERSAPAASEETPSLSASINEGGASADGGGGLSIGGFASWASAPVDSQPEFYSARAERDAALRAEQAARDEESRRIEAEALAAKEALRKASDAEYVELKATLNRGALIASAGGAAYLLLAYGPDAAASYGLGATAGVAYWTQLVGEVDTLSLDNSPPPPPRPEGLSAETLQWTATRARGALQRAFTRRLVFPASLPPLWALWNGPLGSPGVHLQLPLLWVGFFAYKLAIVYWAYDEEVGPTWWGKQKAKGVDWQRAGTSVWLALGVIAIYSFISPPPE